ncbi:MAG: hypothetical protein DDT26_00318 [Dehalococcoidia bacterium]|nr:hypothetical protein [Chloroflexota bacterium]
MSLATQPSNPNFLSSIGFQFQIERLPNVNWHVTRANIPGMSLNRTDVQTPFRRFNAGADKLEYEDLSVSFKVAEDLSNWAEVHDWMVGIGFPNNFNQRRLLEEQGEARVGRGLRTDGTLIVLNSARVPIMELTFVDLIPNNLTPLEFNTQASIVEYVEATVTFDFQEYRARMLKNR